MHETSVSLLARATSDSDEDAWRQLAEIYTPLMHRWLRKYCVQESDADDLVQDVLLTISRELPSFEHSGNPGAFRAWLRTVLFNRLKALWRAEQNRRTAEARVSDAFHDLSNDSSEASRLFDREHDTYILSRLIEQIRPRFLEKTWQAFRKQMIDGENPNRVAEDLEMPIQAVYVAKSRVLNALRREAEGLIET